MKFQLIDRVLEQTEDRIVARKHVSLAEEYLQDHFPRFPVLPGVLMLEAMAQAARILLDGRAARPLVVGRVRNLRYGSMVRPGEILEVEVTAEALEDGTFDCRGKGIVRRPAGGADGETAATGRFTMRPVREMIDARRPAGRAIEETAHHGDEP